MVRPYRSGLHHAPDSPRRPLQADVYSSLIETGPKLRALSASVFLAAARDQANRSHHRKFMGLDIWPHAAKRRVDPVAKGLRCNRIKFGG
jgi:hypothetical protein